MSFSDNTSVPLIRPDWSISLPHVHALTTLRSGSANCGVSVDVFGDANGGRGFNLGNHVGDDPAHVSKNRECLNAVLSQRVIFPSQVHGNIVADAVKLTEKTECDAVVTDRPDTVCGILTADCLPVLLADAELPVVAAAHAGWRGLAAGVLQNTVAAMRRRGAKQIVAWLGPAIGPQQFEVGQEVWDQFVAAQKNAANCFVRKGDVAATKYLADIYGLARIALGEAGVEQISGGQFCTVSDSERFYSYRRDGRTGRMASLIWAYE